MGSLMDEANNVERFILVNMNGVIFVIIGKYFFKNVIICFVRKPGFE